MRTQCNTINTNLMMSRVDGRRSKPFVSPRRLRWPDSLGLSRASGSSVDCGNRVMPPGFWPRGIRCVGGPKYHPCDPRPQYLRNVECHIPHAPSRRGLVGSSAPRPKIKKGSTVTCDAEKYPPVTASLSIIGWRITKRRGLRQPPVSKVISIQRLAWKWSLPAINPPIVL